MSDDALKIRIQEVIACARHVADLQQRPVDYEHLVYDICWWLTADFEQDDVPPLGKEMTAKFERAYQELKESMAARAGKLPEAAPASEQQQKKKPYLRPEVTTHSLSAEEDLVRLEILMLDEALDQQKAMERCPAFKGYARARLSFLRKELLNLLAMKSSA